ncbi:Mu transposase C-terminal domain-containing protein [Pseudonocardia sp. TRM90224]|uniref:Mu transposase C-terminal domain-containing protein n=1 Tax=Pseudonocardia sp. TRM90224 TaxID=2812678 RepID=UPI001E5A77E4|nr:Mu transposase C-terminal domain-containing protein [Pseudonocardia sp. TRM90224]
MSRAAVRVKVGTRFSYDGETAEVVEMAVSPAGNEVVLKDGRGQLLRLSLKELLLSDRAAIIPDEPGPSGDDDEDVASVVLGQLDAREKLKVLERAEHVREILTGFRSGTSARARDDEPRPEYSPGTPLESRYAAKAAELEAGLRTVKRWVAEFRANGEAGLATKRGSTRRSPGGADERWVETALEVMVEHTGESKPSRTMVIERTNARVVARFGRDVVAAPSRASAFRVLSELERRHPLFRLSTKRNRDIAERPDGVYGKLRPTRPGEYLLMDSTRLDVFAFDPLTLRWVQAELSVSMDWYTRCITGIRLTPVSTKSVDVAAVLYESFRPRPAGQGWPRHAVWPEHGIPRSVLVDVDAVDGPGLASPALVPETLIVDHGKVYVSEHLTSVCARMGISIQPARLRTGRDKGPVERFFRTLREDLLQALPGYKGPDIYSRGENPENDAFFFLDELEAIIREWVAIVYHRRQHDGLVDPGLPGLQMSPAAMFEHGIARAGYIEVPRDPDLAYEFLSAEWRTIQHYGVEYGGRRYNGEALDPYRNMASTYSGKQKGRWPIHVDADDVSRVYFRDPATREWHTLHWEHAPSMQMPLSEDALRFARKLAAARYTYPDDKIAVADLLERWNVGLGNTRAERRMALRLSRERSALIGPEPGDTAEANVTQLPSVAKVLAASAADTSASATSVADTPGRFTAGIDEHMTTPGRAIAEPAAETGDDDEADFDPDDFYADALEDV